MRTALLPKEHGAYGQMTFPLVTALFVSGITTPALLIVIAVVAAFLAHEPAVVLIGMRGARARRDLSGPARVWAIALVSIALVAGVLSLTLTPTDMRWAFALPLVPAAVLVGAIVARKEKSWLAEITVALSFSLAAVPVCLASGATLAVACAVAIPFALIFVAGTLAVRTVILRVRGGGDPRAAALSRAASLGFSTAAVAIVAVAARRALVPWSVLWAALPGLVLASAVAVRSPAPSRLKTIGWLLVGASTIAAIVGIIEL